MLAGTAKLAVSCEHIALRYKTADSQDTLFGHAHGRDQAYTRFQNGTRTTTDTPTDKKAFVELPKDLCSHNRVAAIGLLPTHRFGSIEARRTEEDIVFAVLKEFPTDVTVYTLPTWTVDPIRDTTELRGAQIGGATLTDPVTGTGATPLGGGHTRSFQFHQTCPIDKAKEGALAYWLDCQHTDDCILGLYTRGANDKQRRRDFATTTVGQICPLRDLQDFGLHDVVEPPKAGSDLILIDGDTRVSISTSSARGYPERFSPENDGDELYGVFINTRFNDTYQDVESVVNVDFASRRGHTLNLGVASMPAARQDEDSNTDADSERAVRGEENKDAGPEIPSYLRGSNAKKPPYNRNNQNRGN